MKTNLGTDLEREFYTRWLQLSGPALESEYEFHPTRKWRFDFVHAVSLIAIELDGGTWARKGAKKCQMCGQIPKGGHSTGTGIKKDYEKQNEAILMGWQVFRFTTDMIKNSPIECIEPIIKLIEKKSHT